MFIRSEASDARTIAVAAAIEDAVLAGELPA